jgi:DNA-binding NtrC family response regulator
MPEKILIVDDDPGPLNAMKVGLVSYGFFVVPAQTGTEALAFIKKAVVRHDPFDLMITDFRMPGMNGLELIPAARRAAPFMPVILITGYGSEWLIRDAERAGIAGYLDKPFTPGALFRKIVEITGRGNVGKVAGK